MSASSQDPSSIDTVTARPSSAETISSSPQVAVASVTRSSAVLAALRKFVRREHSPVTVRQMMRTFAVRKVFVPALFLAAFGGTSHALESYPLLPMPGTFGPERREDDDEQTAADAAMALIRNNDCWMSHTPSDMVGKVPGHAVVTFAGADGPVLGGDRAVRLGLEHEFEGKHPNMQVHAFCR